MSSNKCSVNILEFIGKPATSESYGKVEKFVRLAYGQDYPAEKFNLLWSLLKEEKWSEERLFQVAKHFIKNNKWKNWVPADWFQYRLEVHGYNWAIEENHKSPGAMARMEIYNFNGVPVYRYPDGMEIPLPKWEKV